VYFEKVIFSESSKENELVKSFLNSVLYSSNFFSSNDELKPATTTNLSSQVIL
jgi:hypothetical protein